LERGVDGEAAEQVRTETARIRNAFVGRVYKANLESQLFHMESQLNQAIAREKAYSHRSSYIEPLPNLMGGFPESITLFRAAMDSPHIHQQRTKPILTNERSNKDLNFALVLMEKLPTQ